MIRAEEAKLVEHLRGISQHLERRARSWYAPEMSDDEIIQQSINGRSIRAIARAHGCAVTEVNAVIDRFADATIDEKTRKHSLALELARLDQLQETFYAQALDGDLQSGALVAKLIERRCVMLGLSTGPTATLQIVEAKAPREGSTARILAAIDRICGKVKPDEPDDPEASKPH